MKTIFVFALCMCVQNCYGRFFPGRFFRYKSRGIPIIKSELWDAGTVKPPAPTVCEDNPDYANGCPGFAAILDYCKDQADFMTKNCPKSCGICSGKPPAQTACEDDTDYADGCATHAAIPNYCTYHEDFMRKHCPKTCEFCSEVTSQPPVKTQPLASIGECKDDPSYDCKDIAGIEGLCKEQEEFTRENCALSCGWCVTTSPAKIPAPEICEQDLPKWAHKCSEWAGAGECGDPKKQIFMEHYCRKSCKLPCKPEPSPNPGTKPPGTPAFCRDRDVNCAKWKSLGLCASPTDKARIYCGVTCDICKAPIPQECYDKAENCQVLKNEGKCRSTNPTIEYEVKTNCLVTCGFCRADFP